MLSYTLTDASAVVLVNNRIHNVPSDHPRFEDLKAALLARDEAAVEVLVNLPRIVAEYVGADPEFTVEGGLVHYEGESFAEAVSDKVLRMIQAGTESKGLLNFLRKVRLNPSRVAQEELMLFWVAIGGLIHEDGDLIGFKGVNANFTDIHSGHFSNVVGAVHEMERRKVDDRRDVTCSYGFHIGSEQYARGFAQGHVMIVKANPKDVVSVPNDSSNQKCRTCRYEVIGELEGVWQNREVYNNVQLGITGRDDEEVDDDDDDDEEEKQCCDHCLNYFDGLPTCDNDGNTFCREDCLTDYHRAS